MSTPSPAPAPPAASLPAGTPGILPNRPRVRTGLALCPRDGILSVNNVKATSISFLPKETTALFSPVRLGFLSRHSAHGFLIPLSASGTRHPAAAGKALHPRAPPPLPGTARAGLSHPPSPHGSAHPTFPGVGNSPGATKGSDSRPQLRLVQHLREGGGLTPQGERCRPTGPGAGIERRGVPEHQQGFCLFFNHIQEEGKPVS